MKLTPIEIQGLRDFILQCARRFSRGIAFGMLQSSVRAAGFHLEADGPDSLEAHLEYLKEKNLLAPVDKAHTPSLSIWKLTAAGDDYMRVNKLD